MHLGPVGRDRGRIGEKLRGADLLGPRRPRPDMSEQVFDPSDDGGRGEDPPKPEAGRGERLRNAVEGNDVRRRVGNQDQRVEVLRRRERQRAVDLIEEDE